MKPAIFIDTSYFLALVNSRDKYHQQAKSVAEQILPPFVTSEAVLYELGNALAKPPHRMLGIQALRQIRQDRNIEVVNIGSDLFAQIVTFYQSRPDKAWGLTDCSSFVIMQQRRLHEALTADRHFEQAGFMRLLQ
ncbi:type II toxin-antitoxin system VapC family toxin [Candidatus Leptofilum sp.]|uniref:type II toxin-antitoxin system VapC family toxin n=1 Tax=Candidatus Leptofilum sp. TaxID=3241576 RepID=UPI003B5AB20A